MSRPTEMVMLALPLLLLVLSRSALAATPPWLMMVERSREVAEVRYTLRSFSAAMASFAE